jgi:sugar/nucleoside kinase (ribokinase family)
MLRFDLVGIGNPVYDIIVTPWSKTKGRVLSGCSTNACLAAKRLGMERVGLVGCIGPDFAQRFHDEMQHFQLEFRMKVGGMETGGFQLIYDENGNRTLDVLGVAGKLTRDNFPEEFLDTEYLLIGPILGEVDLELIQFLRSSSNARIFLDPQGLIRIVGKDKRIVHQCNNDEFGKIRELVDFIKPNEHESETITSQKDTVLALQRLRGMSASVPIVTLAERGSVLLNGDELYRIPAYPTRALDPTGAGDVYAGSFITEHKKNGNLSEAALFASAAASLMVEQSGPDFEIPLDKVQERKEAIRGRLIVERFS